jgi:acetoacetyl-CoA synthetase
MLMTSQALQDETTVFPRPAFFPGAKLNFAENLLYPHFNPPEDSVAVIAATEQRREKVSWRQLRQRVRACTAAMQRFGVKEHDRVAGYLANHTNTLVAMLAATSLGAIWTGVSPDTGVTAVLDRLEQVQPKLLFADNAVLYNGKEHSVKERLVEIVGALDQLEAVVVFETAPDYPFELEDVPIKRGKALFYKTFLDRATSEAKERDHFVQLPADHPIYILFSSGTTGKPKCIVHGAIGTLLQHKKEHELQCDLRPGDRLFYFTTCTWMMWHWLVSGLASGATLILYDGSPFRPLDDPNDPSSGGMAMPRLIESLGITHFGTSAKYLSLLEQADLHPRTHPISPVSLSSLKAIYSTGSPLAPSTFDYVYRAFGDVHLGSITGGTDIISLFGAPSPTVPVYRGEVQCRGLGLAVEAWDSVSGADITASGEAGDLVCVKPFPCQPVGFWGDDAAGSRYRGSYFERFSDAHGNAIWHHGDFVRIDPKTSGLLMLGRSDGVLKPAGVRFGSAEIYNVVQREFAKEVADALCIGRRRESDPDETVVLFLLMANGFACDKALVKRVKAAIATALSRRHVPGIVDACPEIPVTTNGKKVEIAVKQILSGMDIKTSASVANAQCLDWFREWARTHA